MIDKDFVGPLRPLEQVEFISKFGDKGIIFGPVDKEVVAKLYPRLQGHYSDHEKNVVLFPEKYVDVRDKIRELGGIVEEKVGFKSTLEMNLKMLPYVAKIQDNRVVIKKQRSTGIAMDLWAIPSAIRNWAKDRWEIPLADAWRLDDFFIANADVVKVADSVKQVILTQGERRAKLDIIAQADDSDMWLPEMGGVKFRNFQKMAVDYVVTNGYKGLVAFDMGLGKTLIALTAAEHYRLTKKKDKKLKVLCIVPTAVIPNWKREIRKYAGEDRPVYTIEGGKPQSPDTIKQVLLHDDGYFLIGYPSMGSYVRAKARLEIKENGDAVQHDEVVTYMWAHLLNMGKFELAILDESHFIKTRNSHRTKGVLSLDLQRVIQLSGTPLLNRPAELHSLIKRHDPVLAGPAEAFERHFTAADGRSARNLDELRDTLKTFMIRRTKADVMKDLPPVNRIEESFDLSDTAWKDYQDVLKGIYRELDGMGNVVSEKDVPNILARIMRLKQVCARDKIDYIADLATEIYDQTEEEHKKVIVFSQFVNTPPMVSEIAKRLGAEALWFSGRHKPEERQAMVDRFNTEDDIHFLCVGIQAGGTGLNMTAAGSVIFCDHCWRPADHLQAEGRAYGRLNDPHSISAYYITAVKEFGDETVKTVEGYIQDLLAAKLEVIDSIIDGTEKSRMDVSIAKEIIRTIIANRKSLLREKKK